MRVLAKLKAQLKAQGGFTLIEMLVVVAIIAILITLAIPRVVDSINKSKQAQDDADMHSISLAAEQQYMNSNPTQYPDTWAEIAATGILKSSVSGKNAFGHGYVYLTDTNSSFYVLADPGNTPSGVTTVSITCNSKTDTATIGATFTVMTAVNIAGTDVAGGCSAKYTVGSGASAKDVPIHFVTN